MLVRNTAAVANSAALPLLTASVLCGIAMLEPTALGVQLLLLGLLLLTVSARYEKGHGSVSFCASHSSLQQKARQY